MTTQTSKSPRPSEWVETIRDLLEDKPAVLVDGSAGTGKTRIVQELLKSDGLSVEGCAPTGVAAQMLGVHTVHKLLYASEEELRFENVDLQRAEILVVDEISMVRADVLDALDKKLRRVRRDDSPLGGLRVVLVGDPLQLAPVKRRDEEWNPAYRHEWFTAAFLWNQMELCRVPLTIQHRQANDPVFADLLNRIRTGRHTQQDLQTVNQRVVGESKTEWPFLAAKRDAVDRENENRMREHRGESLGVSKAEIPRGAKDHLPKHVELKTGARYMVLRNGSFDGVPYFNGLMATLESLIADDGGELLELRDESSGKNFLLPKQPVVFGGSPDVDYQFPITPAYAMTIHKAQGLTLPGMTLDPDGIFAHGQAYVALSRLRSLHNLELVSPLKDSHISVARDLLNDLAELETCAV